MVLTVLREFGSEHEVKMVKEWQTAYKRHIKDPSASPPDDDTKAGMYQNLKAFMRYVHRLAYYRASRADSVFRV